MKIAVVSAYTENIKNLYKITSKTLVEYCNLHNYHLLISKISSTILSAITTLLSIRLIKGSSILFC